jgi:phage N-6-adenine-methyltransferase
MLNDGVMSSRTDEWSTPDSVFRPLMEEFGFTLDVCASPMNAKCPRYFTRSEDGLSQAWSGVCWMNPPYGRSIGKWIVKAWESSRRGSTVVCLIPSRTDTAWWHDYVMRGEIRFYRGRIYFDGPVRDRAPFPSAVVIFRAGDTSGSLNGMAKSQKRLTRDEVEALARRAESAGQRSLAHDLTAIVGRMDMGGRQDYDDDAFRNEAYFRGLDRLCRADRKPQPRGIMG